MARLEKQGFVVRRQAADDPRAVEAVLTAAGLAKMQECAPAHVREARRLVIDVLTPTQVEQLGRIATKLLDVVAPDTAATVADHVPAGR